MTKTAEQVKAEYKARGIPLAHIAREMGWRPQDVYKILNGVSRGNYGKPYDIAVFFGLIDGSNEKVQNNTDTDINKTHAKVTPTLEIRYQNKVYDVSHLPVVVGQKLYVGDCPNGDGVQVSITGDAWVAVPQSGLDKISYPLTNREQWALCRYRELDDCDQTVIDYLMSLLANRNVGGADDEQ